MPNPISHFDIQADDVERARHFYERVFGWRFEAFGPPDFYMVFTGEEGEPGIHGSVSKREEPLRGGGRSAWECTLAVDDLAKTRAAIVEHGGTISMDEYEIVGVGRMIKFRDPEGNVACAMHYD